MDGKLVNCWSFRTGHGLWRIQADARGRWHPMFDDEDLGSYASPEMALDDLCGGHALSPSAGLDFATCGLPDELADWQPHFRQTTD